MREHRGHGNPSLVESFIAETSPQLISSWCRLISFTQRRGPDPDRMTLMPATGRIHAASSIVRRIAPLTAALLLREGRKTPPPQPKGKRKRKATHSMPSAGVADADVDESDMMDGE